VDFQAATDKLMACGVTLADIARAAGVTHQTIRRARLSEDSTARLQPPPDWPSLLAQVARDRCTSLDTCSDDLTALADDLEAQLGK